MRRARNNADVVLWLIRWHIPRDAVCRVLTVKARYMVNARPDRLSRSGWKIGPALGALASRQESRRLQGLDDRRRSDSDAGKSQIPCGGRDLLNPSLRLCRRIISFLLDAIEQPKDCLTG